MKWHVKVLVQIRDAFHLFYAFVRHERGLRLYHPKFTGSTFYVQIALRDFTMQ